MKVARASSAQANLGEARAIEAGDRLSVTFTVADNDGNAIELADLDDIAILLSGPTTNYQRVLPRERDEFFIQDVAERATQNRDGSWTYVFEDPIPSTYAPPIYDTNKFTTGELTGQPLLAGTYTVGMRVVRNFQIGDEVHRDVGNAVKDFPLGNTADTLPREVVKIDNCNRCHVGLRVHSPGQFNINAADGTFRDTKLCVLCHTAGAEDIGSTDEDDDTNVTTEFKILIHKIHNGAHLPSVLGVTTNLDGTRNYDAIPDPFEVGSEEDREDFSDVFFPVWPNLSLPMPRDQGYSALTSAQKAVEDQLRRGTTDCAKCHGDPDGDEPLTAPTQGDLAMTQLSRRACGSCHDDWLPDRPYTANGQTMPAQATDDACVLCHVNTNNTLNVRVAHVHPLEDSALNLGGLNFEITSLTEAGANDGDETIDPGEKIAVTLTIKDDNGTDITADKLASISAALSGPTANYNIISYNGSIPPTMLGAGPNFTLNFPSVVHYEFLGTATGGADVFNTSLTPIITQASTFLQERTATGGGDSTLSAAATAVQNFVDVANAGNFARNDVVVIEDGVAGKEEYLRIQNVIGSRLFFASPLQASSVISDIGTTYRPGLRFDHPAGAAVAEVTLTTHSTPADWSITDAAGGQITLVAGKFTGGNKLIVTYTSDFVMPAVFPTAVNESPDLGETVGKWMGKSITSGTYTLGIWGSRSVNISPLRQVVAGAPTGDDTSYRVTSPGNNKNFLVGDAATVVPYSLISSSDNCKSCHNDIIFHGGGRRGFDTCILCHGTAGAEDRPRYTATNAPDTSGVTIAFRTMLHKIHMGEELDKAETYTVVGFGGTPFPNNFTAFQFEEIKFPALPGRAKHCDKCHGADNDSWKEPAQRNHPTEQDQPTLSWRVTCGACHDADEATAHLESQTSPISGAEACAVCHGRERDEAVEFVHKNR